MIRTYSNLIKIPTFEERLEYLKLDGKVGDETFGFERYLNQKFYRSAEWKSVRTKIITRDMGCDMAFPDYEIKGPIYIHHLNPITTKDIKDLYDDVINPEFLVCVSFRTHQYIHYGTESHENQYKPIERSAGDTLLWLR